MADALADPRLFYQRHIFMCTNVRPEGHPRGCRSAGGSEKLCGYMREKARQMGIENIRCNASGCLERCELGPNMVIYPEASGTTTRPLRASTRSWRPTSRTTAGSRG
jgi:hypothetical protein